MELSFTSNPAIIKALKEIVLLFHDIHLGNVYETRNRVNKIRKELTEEEQLTVVSMLIILGVL